MGVLDESSVKTHMTFPVHLFLRPSLYPSLYPLINLRLLMNSLSYNYTEQKRLLDLYCSENSIKSTQENNDKIYGIYKLSGIDDEYSIILCNKSSYKNTIVSYNLLQADYNNMQIEWHNKLIRDTNNNNKLLSAQALQYTTEINELKERERSLQLHEKERDVITHKLLTQQAQQHKKILNKLEQLYEKKQSINNSKRIEDNHKYKEEHNILYLSMIRQLKQQEKKYNAEMEKYQKELSNKESSISTLNKNMSLLKEETINLLNDQADELDEDMPAHRFRGTATWLPR